MRTLSLVLITFAALAAPAAAITRQEKVTLRWPWVAPESEAFSVLMPEPPLRVRRVIPFSEELKLTVPVYEVAHRGVLFSLLSIDKKGAAAALKTSSDFVTGLGHAIRRGSRAGEGELIFERDVTLNSQTTGQYLVRADGKEGTAHVYETATHYYVLMTLGARESESPANYFFNSFTTQAERTRGGTSQVAVTIDSSRPPRAPEPLWPVAGSKSDGERVVGPDGPIGPFNPEGAVRASNPPAPSADETPVQNAISGGVLNGKATTKPQPAYPPIAIAARAHGVVVVQVTVDEEGYVISARATSGHPLLQQAAVKAARQARFAPTRYEGKPVKVRGVITYNFVLEPDPSEPPTRKY